ncbi:hypothetical protein HanRHA438_Chr08g0364931 [Helianthus annuus]|nr:hypothetical protein HanHA300_Chr08g0291051 [Helianthus annuus]KAJ0554574.1 hypothetical protein HanHA89_Chr08g0309471 [Helianthus annuus]KAJ0720137.1 hypothetical protein HanLR1_Chr08g0289801 [Helianthus annuus]KAJ0723366.1 hypothetical protein HanOQP8_Chr08g0297321 [Helianthus annuus]KAJ0899140.1 hypothetical protein HanRHA438_Chr08g0364931 [Helianthus annuus]
MAYGDFINERPSSTFTIRGEIGQEDRVLRTPIRVGDAAPMVYIDWKLWHAH